MVLLRLMLPPSPRLLMLLLLLGLGLLNTGSLLPRLITHDTSGGREREEKEEEEWGQRGMKDREGKREQRELVAKQDVLKKLKPLKSCSRCKLEG